MPSRKTSSTPNRVAKRQRRLQQQCLHLSDPSPLPDKAHFKIGEVSKITGLPAHVLRYWETEFPGIHPEKTSTNHRVYARGDIEQILRVRDLLYRRGYTIAGARRSLRGRAATVSAEHEMTQFFSRIRHEITDLLAAIEADEP